MSQCRGELHRNPAYSPSDTKANGMTVLTVSYAQSTVICKQCTTHYYCCTCVGIDEIDRAADSGVSEVTRGLEHTYEMIDTIR